LADNELDLAIQKMWNEEKLTATDIAEKLETSRSSILGKVWRLRKKGMFFAGRDKSGTENRRKPAKGKQPPRHSTLREDITDFPDAVTTLYITTGCRFPVEGWGVDMLMCNRRTPEDQSFCKHHQAIAYQPESERKRQNKLMRPRYRK
jgi:hypothetical protein